MPSKVDAEAHMPSDVSRHVAWFDPGRGSIVRGASTKARFSGGSRLGHDTTMAGPVGVERHLSEYDRAAGGGRVRARHAATPLDRTVVRAASWGGSSWRAGYLEELGVVVHDQRTYSHDWPQDANVQLASHCS